MVIASIFRLKVSPGLVGGDKMSIGDDKSVL